MVEPLAGGVSTKYEITTDYMIVIGITGAVACGKSTVAEIFERFGALRIDADRLGHEVLADPEVKAAIRARWGDDVFTADGAVDRRRLAEYVFSPPPEGVAHREYLQSLSHPRIAALLEQRISEAEKDGCALAVVDAALLFEAGWHRRCHRVIVVDAPEAVRRARAVGRGWSVEQFEARQAAQFSPKEKIDRADFVIDNSGDLSAAERQVRELLRICGVEFNRSSVVPSEST